VAALFRTIQSCTRNAPCAHDSKNATGKPSLPVTGSAAFLCERACFSPRKIQVARSCCSEHPGARVGTYLHTSCERLTCMISFSTSFTSFRAISWYDMPSARLTTLRTCAENLYWISLFPTTLNPRCHLAFVSFFLSHQQTAGTLVERAVTSTCRSLKKQKEITGTFERTCASTTKMPACFQIFLSTLRRSCHVLLLF
jgi:hypothetical protein